MNVLRMIKLFGWESQVETTIAEKREAELKIVWRRKVLELIIEIMKCVMLLLCALDNAHLPEPLAILFLSYTWS